MRYEMLIFDYTRPAFAFLPLLRPVAKFGGTTRWLFLCNKYKNAVFVGGGTLPVKERAVEVAMFLGRMGVLQFAVCIINGQTESAKRDWMLMVVKEQQQQQKCLSRRRRRRIQST